MSVVLGIDPGIARVGYGLLAEDAGQQVAFLDCGILATSKNDALPVRLRILHEDLEQLAVEYAPTVLAMEQIFFGRNSSTAFAVGQACGVILLTAATRGLPVHLYKPAQIKEAVTGSGRADKEQIQRMVTMALRLSAVPQPDDAADGLAVALCHLYRYPYAAAVQSAQGMRVGARGG